MLKRLMILFEVCDFISTSTEALNFLLVSGTALLVSGEARL